MCLFYRYIFLTANTATSRATSSKVGVTSPHNISLMGRKYNNNYEWRNWYIKLEITMTENPAHTNTRHTEHWTVVSTSLDLISSAHHDLHHRRSNQQPYISSISWSDNQLFFKINLTWWPSLRHFVLNLMDSAYVFIIHSLQSLCLGLLLK